LIDCQIQKMAFFKVIKFISLIQLIQICFGSETHVRVNKALSGPCTEVFDQKIIFNKEDIALNPPNPTIPGIFQIHANATVTGTLQYVAAELELRLGDWVSDPLPCQERQPDGCGGRGSCSYCNFCGEFTKLHPTVERETRRFARQNNNKGHPFFNFDNNNNRPQQPQQQNNNNRPPVAHRAPIQIQTQHGENVCPIQPGRYRIATNIDITDSAFINKNLPNEILDDLSPSKDIALYTTLWIYDTRFQDLNTHLSKQMVGEVFDRKKKDWIVGCYRIVSTLKKTN